MGSETFGDPFEQVDGERAVIVWERNDIGAQVRQRRVARPGEAGRRAQPLEVE